MGRDRNSSKREYWRVTNPHASRMLNIGDLPFVPTVEAGKTIDLLRYYTKEEVGQSEILPVLISRGWLTSKKRLDSVNTKVAKAAPKPYFTSVEENELESIISRVVALEIRMNSLEEDFDNYVPTGIVIVTGDITAGSNKILFCDASRGQITVTLPAAEENLTYYIKKIDESDNHVVIDPDSADEIDGNLTFALANPYECIKIICDGTDWWVI